MPEASQLHLGVRWQYALGRKESEDALTFRRQPLGSTLLVFISTSSIDADSVAVDANGRRQTWPAGASKNTTWETGILKMVPPEYPYEARLRRQEGSGRFRLQLDPQILASITQNPTGRPVIAHMIGNDIAALVPDRA